jgi:GNAT superfamily N-acetyltransferase
MSDHPLEAAAQARLLDGRLVSLRALRGADAEAVLALHRHLSDHDRYFRFFTVQPVPLRELAGTLTEPATGRCAVGAFDGDRLIGMAHYTVEDATADEDVTDDDVTVAEVAIVVAHEDHSLGVGTALLKQLGSIARAHGIRRFVADVLGENHLMLTVFFDLGWHCDPSDFGSIRRIEIDLPEVS